MPRCGRRWLGTRVMSRSNRPIVPLSGASSPVMRLNKVVLPAPMARHAGDVAIEQTDRSAVGRKLPGNEVEQGRLAGAVGTDDQPPFPGLDAQVDVGGDAQALERLAQLVDGERGHGLRSPTGRTGAPFNRVCSACQPHRHSRTVPGTSPSGMKLMMMTKTTPSTRFQRSI